MRVVYVSDTDPDIVGGAGTHMRGIAGALASLGHEVTMLCPGEHDASNSIPGVDVQRLQSTRDSITERISFDFKAAAAISEAKPDVVILRLSTFMVETARRAKSVANTFVLEVNGPLWTEIRSERRSGWATRLAAAAIDRQLSLADAAICVTPELARVLADRLPTRSIENGADIASLPEWKQSADTTCELVFAGAFTQWYDIGLVLNFMAQQDVPGALETTAVLIGDGPRRADVISAIQRFDLSSRVELLPWMARIEGLERVSTASVGLVPLVPKPGTTALGSPLKLFDYLAVGIPTVASDLDGCRPTESPLLHHYQAGDLETFSSAVASARSTPPLSAADLAATRQEVSWEGRAAEVMTYVESL